MSIKGVVAAGHEETVKAAEQILRAGGNAFDAIIAAHFAACVAEPVLASLGGGGYLLAHPAGRRPEIYDFFVQTPRTKQSAGSIDFKPISADFGTVTQEFHIGAGSIATPGTIKGIFAVHQDLCSMPMTELVAPALALAKEGVTINNFQGYIFDIVKPILLATPAARAIYANADDPSKVLSFGDLQRMTALADFMDVLAREGEGLFYASEVAHSIAALSHLHGGYLDVTDLNGYNVIKRRCLEFRFADRSIFTNPPPASGGILIAFAMNLLQQVMGPDDAFGDYSYLNTLIDVMRLTNKARLDFHLAKATSNKTVDMLDPEFITQYQQMIINRAQSLRGTTHISVLDVEGNSASMTVSNGEGCGYIIPDTGVMLNNMLGEQDLNPEGFHTWTPNQRMTSMMSPTIILGKHDEIVALGSGGSNRIRTAILQVLMNLLVFKMPLPSAIQAPRIHFEEGVLNIEKGYSSSLLQKLHADYDDQTWKAWEELNLFFGGVHAVQRLAGDYTGVGDPRRGGQSVVVN